MSILQKRLQLTFLGIIFVTLPLLGLMHHHLHVYIMAGLSIPLFVTLFPQLRARNTKVDAYLIALLAGFLMLGWASHFWSVNPEESLKRFYKLLPLFLCGGLFLHLIHAASADIFAKLAKGLFYAVLAGAFLLVIERGFGFPLHTHLTSEVIKPFLTNWQACILVALLWPMLVAGGAWQPKWPLYLMAGLIGYGVFIAESQSAQLALIGGIALFTLVRFFGSAAVWCLGFALIAVLVASPWIANALYAWQPDFLTGLTQASIGQRIEIWNQVSINIMESPFWGHGLEAARDLEDFSTHEFRFLKAGAITHPHNLFLQLWLEIGLIGVLWASAFCLYLFRKIASIKDRTLQAASAALTLTFIVYWGVAYGAWQGWLIGLAFVMAAVMKMILRMEQERA